MKNLNVQAFKEGFENDSEAILVDVRTPEEEAEGLIPNSINISSVPSTGRHNLSNIRILHNESGSNNGHEDNVSIRNFT